MDLNLICLVHGLAFFSMGIVILTKIRLLMDIGLARTFRWLAAFGLIQAIHEWIEMFVIMGHTGTAILSISTFLVALSFAVLLKFGIEIIRIRKNLSRMIQLIPAILFVLWCLFYVMLLPYDGGVRLARMWSGYILGFSGTFLTVCALISIRRSIVEDPHISKNLLFAGVAFAFYGVLETEFFPASLLEPWFATAVGLPVQLFAMLSSIAIIYFIVRSLDVFDILEKRKLTAQVEENISILRESEEKYRILAETSSDAIIMIDEENMILFANRAAEDIFGYSIAEMLGQPSTMLMPESLRQVHQDAIKRYIETGEKHIEWETVDVPGLHKSGEEIPLEISFGEFVRNGKHIFTGIARDISRRKRIEREVHRLSQGIKAVGESIVMTDRQGIIQYVNPAFTRLTDYTAEEAVGQNPRVLQSGRHSREFYQQMWDTILGGEVWSGEVTNQRKDGTLYEAILTIAPLFDQRGELEGFVAVQRDITARKQAEEELKQRQEAFQSLYESAMTWRGSLNDFCDHVVTNLSQLLKVSHVTVERLEGEWIKVISMMADGQLIHEGEMSLASSPCERVRDEKGTCQYQGTLRELFPQDAFFQRYDLHAYLGVPIKDGVGDVIGVIHAMNWRERTFTEDEIHLLEIFARSISQEIERNTIETQLRQAQKMEAVGQLAGGIAHDFNNLLTAIQGYTDLALAAVSEEEPVYRDLMEVRRASVRAATLTRQLLIFSRQQTSEKEILSVNGVIEDMSKMLHRLIGEDISLRVELAPDLWNVEADPGQMEQVLMNLVVNARDAMPEGGNLIIKTENVHIDETYCHIHTYSTRAVCLSFRRRCGDGDGCGHAGAYLRAFFYHKGSRQGHRTGTLRGLRHRQGT